jgi:hypothetical protein
MAWRCEERAKARDYKKAEERKNFQAGYSDGYHGYAMWASSERNWYPNAYSAGYWEGKADRDTKEPH